MNESTFGDTSHVTVGRKTRSLIDDNEFVITQCRRDDSNENSNNQTDKRQDSSEESDMEEKILVVYWRAGKLGAAYYTVQTSELHILEEIVDRPPEYQMLASLHRQVEPAHLVAEGKAQGHFTKHLKKMVFQNDSARPGVGHCKLDFVSSKEYNFEACKRRIFSLSLPYEPKDCSDDERSIFLRTTVNFSQTQSVHALGALLRYLDLNWSNLELDFQGKPTYMALNKISLADIVTIDEETYTGLQIFRSVAHPASYKRGAGGSSREGLSLYNLFNKCCSKLGQSRLRVFLQHPTHDIATLTQRQDVIEFFMRSQNESLMKNICSSLRYIKNVNGIMAKIISLSAKPFQWKSLYNTLYNAVLICEMCESARGGDFLHQLGSSGDKQLYEMALHMNKIIDFELSKIERKFTVRAGVDPELDKKKQTMSCLHALMSETARQELERLPEHVQECAMLYMPHLGYLLGVRQWAPTLTAEEKQLPDMKFMFQNNNYIHYKSKGCEELDMMIGDTYPEIVAHETKIKMRLTALVATRLRSLAALVDKCAELDCLISIAKVCKEYNFVRPVITEEKVINIVQGKHPLHMISSDNFIPNDTLSDEDNGFVKILTGPNSSGKSVYLKQVSLIVYLCHVGSFVPATAARVGTLTHVHTRLHSAECVAAHMSAFLVDLRQTSLALSERGGRALLAVDEFGKGTGGADGRALLAAALNTLLCRGRRCPHLLLATHFLDLPRYVLDTPLLRFQRLEYMMDGDEPVFLFKLAEGSVDHSFAHQVAKASGIDHHVVNRATDVLDSKKASQLPAPNKKIMDKLKSLTAAVKHDLRSE